MASFYGPHITNQLIREALQPYPDDLMIVTKVGAVRGEDASWIPATASADPVRAVHDNPRNLGVDVLDVVNLRLMGRFHEPREGSIEEPFTALAEPRRQGLIRHPGVGNVTSAQVAHFQLVANTVPAPARGTTAAPASSFADEVGRTDGATGLDSARGCGCNRRHWLSRISRPRFASSARDFLSGPV